MKHWQKLLLLGAAVLLVAWCRPGAAETIDGVCTTTDNPCRSWRVMLPDRWQDHPSVVLRRCYDCERPDEGVLTINGGCTVDLFGTNPDLASNDAREVPRLSYEVPSSCWRPRDNTAVIRWTTATNPNDPAKHAVRGGLAVELVALAPVIPAQCRRARIPPTADYWFTRRLTGCSDGQGELTTFVAILNPEQVRAIFDEARGMMQNLPGDPVQEHSIILLPTEARSDICTLWPESEGC